ncbi:MAG: acetyl-CoA carboxylase biotin carboxyl carrier protein [Oscillospiraceae bacterium]
MTIELESLYQLMERFSRSDLTVLEWHSQGDRIVFKRESTFSPPAEPARPDPLPKQEPEPTPALAQQDEGVLKAPLVGTFYAAPSPGEPPFVSQGQTVREGETMCIIEAMKMMIEIAAPFDGVVAEIFAQDSQPVGYGEPLLRIRRD